MIRCIIVDDEPHAIELLSMHIEQTGFLELVGTATSPVKALQLAFEQKVEVVFLDVQMPEMSGIEFIQLLNGRCKVILVTAYKDYAIQGFDHDVIDYLLKPVTFARFLKSTRKLLDLQKDNHGPDNDYIFVNAHEKGKLLRINIADIIYVEGQKQYVCFLTREGNKHLSRLPLKELESRLPTDKFIRVHKSFVLAVQYITMIHYNAVYLAHTTAVIPIGSSYREAFMNRMKDKIY
ncbi:LytR/AlgR family response regulator transcription factor [Chitinophaga nivalis]|uniref:Response regulator n=1 Tax=Chitinophaga nivalis TaxID=2991709 RepID=A0ABT3ITI1_9BACT|nr:response regulator [Chitinophaga nivalis]MCW3463013.1 response regulator [Chitinophaga nivalis]MCW3487297.1 response regulator [Chitinophaga nivalis]